MAWAYRDGMAKDLKNWPMERKENDRNWNNDAVLINDIPNSILNLTFIFIYYFYGFSCCAILSSVSLILLWWLIQRPDARTFHLLKEEFRWTFLALLRFSLPFPAVCKQWCWWFRELPILWILTDNRMFEFRQNSWWKV